jgi:hypothetical protein
MTNYSKPDEYPKGYYDLLPLSEVENVKIEVKDLLKTEVFVNMKLPTGMFDIKTEVQDGILKMKSYVLSEDIETKTKTLEFKYPKTWWQHFKYDHFPQWLLDIFPVQFKTETKKCRFTAKAFYPNVKFTPNLGNPVVKVFAY